VAVNLTWNDSTIFPNALGSDVSNYIDPQTYLGFSSSNPTVISIDALGEATLLQNYHNYVNITTAGAVTRPLLTKLSRFGHSNHPSILLKVLTLTEKWMSVRPCTTASTCPDNSISAASMVSASESVAANLNPPLGDVDLGLAVGLQYGDGVATGRAVQAEIQFDPCRNCVVSSA